jgi:hypothetical protein
MPSFPNPENIKRLLGMGQKTSAPRVRVAPLPTEAEKRQAKALKDLMDKRKAVVKKTGVYPNYNTN